MARPIQRVEIPGWDSVRWPDPVKGPWHIAGRWALIDGRRELIGLELFKGCEPSPRDMRSVVPLGDGPSPIATADLRLPLAAISAALLDKQREGAAVAAAHLDSDGESGTTAPAEVWNAWFQTAAQNEDLLEDVQPARRRRRDDNLLRKVADIYDRANQDHKPPTKAVQEALIVSHSTATKYVAQARAAGFLPATTAGRQSPVRTSRKKNR